MLFWKGLKKSTRIRSKNNNVRALEVSNEILSLAIRAGDRLIIMSKKSKKFFSFESPTPSRDLKAPKFRTKRLEVQKMDSENPGPQFEQEKNVFWEKSVEHCSNPNIKALSLGR